LLSRQSHARVVGHANDAKAKVLHSADRYRRLSQAMSKRAVDFRLRIE
jgi:hypothetical protein